MYTGLIPVYAEWPPKNCFSAPRIQIAIATSSRLALPARSPMPLMVHSTWRAPLATPASEFAVDNPRSFWQCVLMTYSPGTAALMPAMSAPTTLAPKAWASNPPWAVMNEARRASHSAGAAGTAGEEAGAPDEVRAAYAGLEGTKNVLGLTNYNVLMQEYLKGDEYVVDTMSRDGVHKCVAIWKYIKQPLNGVANVFYGQRLMQVDKNAPATDPLKRMVKYIFGVLDALFAYLSRTVSAPRWIGERGWIRHSPSTARNSPARRSQWPSISRALAFFPPGSSSSLAMVSARSRS